MTTSHAVTLNGAIRLLRAALGTLLIFTVLVYDSAPTWFAVLATYPIFTAMLARDPFYSLTALLRATWATRSSEMRDALPAQMHPAT